MAKTTVSKFFRLSPEVVEALEKQAEKEGDSQNAVVEKALAEYCGEEELSPEIEQVQAEFKSKILKEKGFLPQD